MVLINMCLQIPKISFFCCMRNLHFSLTLIVGLLIFNSGFTQSSFVVNVADSKVWVDGTSTLKNWSAKISTFDGKIEVDSLGNVTSVVLNFDASTMDGGRGPDMNAKIYKALKTTEYPMITFEGNLGNTDADFDLSTEGTLSIAGQSAKVLIQGNGSLEERLTGSHALKLSQFNIEPPTAMFGQIVCHDDLTIGFDLSFTQQTP